MYRPFVKMTYEASVQSTTSTIATYARKIVHSGRPDMEIILDHHDESKVYTTFDALSGRVEITAAQSARFDEIQITLEGSTRVWVENLSPHSTRAKITANHNFLRLIMPIQESDYPQPRIAEAGRTYTFPFNFVIPDQLLPRACYHRTTCDHIHLQHISMPPSMGDREVSGLDDLAPAMARVLYAIKVRVVRYRERNGDRVVLTEGLRKLHVVPAIPEAAPMNVMDADKEYRLARTKVLRKGMFSGKLGKIHVSAAQPSAIILPSPNSHITTPPTTIATLNLRFDPQDKSSQPPRLGGLTTKIRASTFYSARAAAEIPTHFSVQAQFEAMRGVYDTSMNLSSRCVESVAWVQHAPSPAYTRRDSASSVSSSSSCPSDTPLSDASSTTLPYYTSQIVVPITLPASKTWVPTFHSCIASRVYVIDMSLSIHTPGAGVPATTVNLHLPVQIGAEGNVDGRPEMTESERMQEMESLGAQAYLTPRFIEVPRDELLGNSVLVGRTRTETDLPPSYDASPRIVVAPGRS